MQIKGILVSMLAPLDNHMANGGEKLLGNASSIKRTPDGKVYISGQMQRHVLFSAMERINDSDMNKGKTFISNGDGVTNLIETDLRADMGGFMHPSKGDYSGRRTAPLSATIAVALDKSEIGRDLLIRLKQDPNTDSKDQALATKEFSEHDLMNMNFHLDITSLSISKTFKYEGGYHLATNYIKHAKDDERKRRATLFLESTRSMSDYANQARNAVSGEPQKVLIVFDNKLSRKASRYFATNNETEKSNILAELKERNAKYFFGDDTNGEKSVAAAYKEAFKFLNSEAIYDPTEGKGEIKTFKEAFGKD
jgi:CRISPR-associated protein Cst2